MAFMNFCIGCLCGLPGSGKTSVCKQLRFQLENPSQNEDDHDIQPILFLVFDFDKILLDPSCETPQLWPSLVGCCQKNDQMNDGESLMKQARTQVLMVVEFLLQTLLVSQPDDIMDKLVNPGYICDDVWSSAMSLCWDKLLACDFTKTRHVFLLIDDNMYFHSMRYEYYQKARLYKTGFCIIAVSSSIEKCKERNSNRCGKERVEDSVIDMMNLKFEAPDGSKNSWEKFNVTVDTDGPHIDLNDAVLMIKEAFANPVELPLQTSDEDRLNSQTASSSSIIHQADLILRKCISKTLKTSRSSKVDLKRLGKHASSVKENLLQLMRKGLIIIPDGMSDSSQVTDSSKDENCDMFKYMENLFDVKWKNDSLPDG